MQEHTSRGIKPNDPSESKDIVQSHQDDGNFGNCNGRSAHRLEERVPLMTTMPLLNSDEPQKSGLSSWLLSLRNRAVVVCLVHDSYDQDERYCPENGEDPVCPWPG